MAALLALVLVAILAGTARILVWPPTDEVSATSADAVVVLAGSGSRLATGQALAERGVAPVLVVSDGGEAHWPAIERVCEAPADYAVRCLTPDPATTRGEARAVGDLADLHGLNRLVVVTSAYHLARAELWLRRCTDAEIRRVATDQPLSTPCLRPRRAPSRPARSIARNSLSTWRSQMRSSIACIRPAWGISQKQSPTHYPP